MTASTPTGVMAALRAHFGRSVDEGMAPSRESEAENQPTKSKQTDDEQRKERLWTPSTSPE
jgi:hypothetical protein